MCREDLINKALAKFQRRTKSICGKACDFNKAGRCKQRKPPCGGFQVFDYGG
jgi:hypothetical protein